jgi:nucleoside-diphosphate-sugar epimerase
VVIVNPGVILGSGFWPAGSGKLFSQVYSGFKYYTEGITGFVSVQDVVKPMILLMNSDVKNERFILVSENKSFKEIFFLIAASFGKKRPSRKVKSWQTAIFWRIAWVVSRITGKEPLLTKYSAKSAHSISKYSSEKVKRTIDFSFEPIEKSVQRICENYPKV